VAVDRDPVSPLVLAAFECAKAIEPPLVYGRNDRIGAGGG
jgi:hypothetical protein